jgi:hypothetical protein
MLRCDLLKANRSTTSVNLFEPHEPHIILLSTSTYACLFLLFGQKFRMGTDGNGYDDYFEDN